MNKKLVLSTLFIILVFISNAQPGGGGLPGGGGSPPCWPPPCVPIDGGISIFTFLSILFGYKFLLKKNK